MCRNFQAFRRRKGEIFASDPQYDDNQRTQNLLLSRRILHTSSKKIRDRLLSYLSYQAGLQKNRYIDIPLNRQQLADYLSLDRSALSKELSKMKKEGLLDYHKNSFVLKDIE